MPVGGSRRPERPRLRVRRLHRDDAAPPPPLLESQECRCRRARRLRAGHRRAREHGSRAGRLPSLAGYVLLDRRARLALASPPPPPPPPPPWLRAEGEERKLGDHAD